MTHIICRAMTCLFWEQGVCAAEEIEYEPDVGCLAFQDIGDFELEEEELEWEEEAEESLSEDDENWEDDDDWDDEEVDG